ncbi:E3 SUMO-protein ligase nse2 [Rhodotorula toruloides]|nr:E3 SUMO-protein ligase nse2 [Rhodotorula toruloides]
MPPASKRKKHVVESDSDGSDVEVEHVERNDKILQKVDPEYLNKPVDLQQGSAKIRLIINSLTALAKDLMTGEETVLNTASEMAELLNEDYKDEDMNEEKWLKALLENEIMSQLEEDFRALIDRQAELKIRAKTLGELRDRVIQGHPVADVAKLFEQRVAEPLSQYRAKTVRQRFIDNERYVEYRHLVWESFTNGSAVPPVKKFLPREDSDEESDDEDIELGAETTTYRCPITIQVLEDPYSSTVCPHAFSGDAIKAIIQQNHGSVDCPETGCHKRLTLQTIKPDEGLARRVAAYKRRVKEGRTQTGTQAKTYQRMELSDEDDDEEEDEPMEGPALKKKIKQQAAD